MATRKTAASKTQNKEVATQNKEVATQDEQMPAFLKDKMHQNAGNENVEADDLVIPRLELVQALSKCRKKTDPQYIQGADEGMLYNNLTRELYGESVNLIPVFFKKEHLVWRDQELGGGFAGAHAALSDAEAARAEQENPEEWECVLTHQHFCLLIREDGSTEEVVVSMAKSKQKISKKFNSLVRINGGPRYSRWYTLSGVPAQNDKGQDYMNLQFNNGGFVTEKQFERAQETYETIRTGAASADYSDAGGAVDAEDYDEDSEI